MENRPTRVRFRKKLKELRDDVERMGITTLKSYRKAMEAFKSYDEDLVNEVFDYSDELDKLNYNLEHKAMSIIAAEQPVAKDLRFIEASLKVSSHYKRIGGLASNIAEVARQIKDEKIPEKPMKVITHMSDIVESMISKSISSFVNQDMGIARGLHRDDDKVDDLFDTALKNITKSMFEEKDAIYYMVYLLFVARFLERIADRSESIGDRTIFMITCEKPM
jgi:phosphate transport system protein